MAELSGPEAATTQPEFVDVDSALVVVNKPAGMLSVPGRGADKQDCVAARIQYQYADALIVHRLDMATSGLLVLARGELNQRRLSIAFAQRQVHKRYLAVVQGIVAPPDSPDGWGVIDLPLVADWPNRPLNKVDLHHGKPSQTRWRVLAHQPATGTTTLALEPVTGRTHQLRVHLQALGHPILGDALYAPPEVQALAPRLLLHASALALPHPETGEWIEWASAPPFDTGT